MYEQTIHDLNRQGQPVATEWDMLDPSFRQPHQQESTNVPGVAEALRPDPEMLKSRIGMAVEKINNDIEPTKEVIESVEGFYTDYYNLGSLAKATLENRVDVQSAQALTEQPKRSDATYLTSAQEALFGKLNSERSSAVQNGDTAEATAADIRLMAFTGQVIDGLFQENALAATTLSEIENNLVQELRQQYRQQMIAKGYFKPSSASPDTLVPSKDVFDTLGVHEANSLFNHQSLGPAQNIYVPKVTDLPATMHAGQLFFHATDRLTDVYRSGQLATRAQQLADYGTYHINTGTGKQDYNPATDHSNAVHFSHGVSVGRYSNGSYDRHLKNGTEIAQGVIALTGAEILRTAPYYGGGEKLGLVKVREAGTAQAVRQKTDEYNGDDLFYASDSLDDPSHPAKTYGYQLFGRHSDGSEREVTIIRTDDNRSLDRHLYGRERVFGSGENMPGLLQISQGGSGTADGEHPQLAQLREYYAQKHQGELIVPLRAKVTNFPGEFPFKAQNPLDQLYIFAQ